MLHRRRRSPPRGGRALRRPARAGAGSHARAVSRCTFFLSVFLCYTREAPPKPSRRAPRARRAHAARRGRRAGTPGGIDDASRSAARRPGRSRGRTRAGRRGRAQGRARQCERRASAARHRGARAWHPGAASQPRRGRRRREWGIERREEELEAQSGVLTPRRVPSPALQPPARSGGRRLEREHALLIHDGARTTPCCPRATFRPVQRPANNLSVYDVRASKIVVTSSAMGKLEEQCGAGAGDEETRAVTSKPVCAAPGPLTARMWRTEALRRARMRDYGRRDALGRVCPIISCIMRGGRRPAARWWFAPAPPRHRPHLHQFCAPPSVAPAVALEKVVASFGTAGVPLGHARRHLLAASRRRAVSPWRRRTALHARVGRRRANGGHARLRERREVGVGEARTRSPGHVHGVLHVRRVPCGRAPWRWRRLAERAAARRASCRAGPGAAWLGQSYGLVGRRQAVDRATRAEPVHLREQLVDHPLGGGVSVGAAARRQRVQLVEEEDARSRGTRARKDGAHGWTRRRTC